MKAPETTIVFAGVNAWTDTDLPEWYQACQDAAEVTMVAEAICDLPRVTETSVITRTHTRASGLETDRFSAIVEPDRLIDQVGDEDETDDPLFDDLTDS